MAITNNKSLIKISALTNYLKVKENFFPHNCKMLKKVVYPGEIYNDISIVQNFDEYNARFRFARGIFLCFLK